MNFQIFLRNALLSLALATCAASVYASAIPSFNLTGTGPIEIKFTGFTAPSAAGGGFGTGKEATFGAGYVGDIHDQNNASNIFWQPGNATGSMSYMMWGLADANYTLDGSGGYNLYNNGCTVGPYCDGNIHISFYLDNTSLMGGTNPGFAGAGSVSPGGRSGNSLGGLTDGVLLMDWILVPGIITGDPSTTLFQHVSGLTLPATGNGSFYAECVTGPACWTFNQTGPDFFGVFTLKDSSPTAAGRNGWLGAIADPVVGVAIPEPTTMLLLVLGLLCLTGAARRRKN